MNQSRQPKGIPVGGQFAASVRGEASAVSLATGPTLPDGFPYTPGQTPDPEVPVRVKDLGDGTALVSYVTSTSFEVDDDQIGQAAYLLREVRNAERVFSGDEYNANALDDYLQASGDSLLDRVAFVRRTGPGTYVAHGRRAAMEDWDEFKDHAHNYDGAIVLPRHCVNEYPVVEHDPASGIEVRDYSMLADDINEIGSGKGYCLVHERVRLSDGSVVGTLEDDYDGTIYDVDEADGRIGSQHDDHDMTIEDTEYEFGFNEDD